MKINRDWSMRNVRSTFEELKRTVPYVDVWALTLLGAFLRIPSLSAPLEGDELYGYAWATKTFAYIATHYFTDNHVFYSFCARLCLLISGGRPSAIRIPSVIAGIACIPLTYALAERITGSRFAARLAALITAVSTTMIAYSTMGRGYALQTFLGLCLLLLLLSRQMQHRRSIFVALLAGFGFLILYTVPTGVVLMIPIYVWLLVKTS